MQARFAGLAGAGLHGSLDDLARLMRELLAPTLVAPETLAEATSVQFPGLAGVIPDLGALRPERLGPRLRAQGRQAAAFLRHPDLVGDLRPLGRDGNFVWVDPERSSRSESSPISVRRLGEGGVASASATRWFRSQHPELRLHPEHRVVGHCALSR